MEREPTKKELIENLKRLQGKLDEVKKEREELEGGEGEEAPPPEIPPKKRDYSVLLGGAKPKKTAIRESGLPVNKNPQDARLMKINLVGERAKETGKKATLAKLRKTIEANNVIIAEKKRELAEINQRIAEAKAQKAKEEPKEEPVVATPSEVKEKEEKVEISGDAQKSISIKELEDEISFIRHCIRENTRDQKWRLLGRKKLKSEIQELEKKEKAKLKLLGEKREQEKKEALEKDRKERP